MTNLEDSLRTRTVDLYRICGPEYMTPPYARPEMFRRFMVPHVKAMTELIHRYGGKVRLHCHGKIAQVLDMFFETGCDATDPCEPPPDGDLPLAEVKRRCAAHGVSVWGNIELKVLEHGSKREVRETVIQCMRDAKEGGGYVLLPTAAPINVPLAVKSEANYRTMIETALEYGRY
jgi:uroporphyrinogen-III decarboxylase